MLRLAAADHLPAHDLEIGPALGKLFSPLRGAQLDDRACTGSETALELDLAGELVDRETAAAARRCERRYLGRVRVEQVDVAGVVPGILALAELELPLRLVEVTERVAIG